MSVATPVPVPSKSKEVGPSGVGLLDDRQRGVLRVVEGAGDVVAGSDVDRDAVGGRVGVGAADAARRGQIPAGGTFSATVLVPSWVESR